MEARSGLSDSSYDDTAKQITHLGISGFISRKMSSCEFIMKVIKEFYRP